MIIYTYYIWIYIYMINIYTCICMYIYDVCVYIYIYIYMYTYILYKSMAHDYFLGFSPHITDSCRHTTQTCARGVLNAWHVIRTSKMLCW